jgi:hypothetical protein
MDPLGALIGCRWWRIAGTLRRWFHLRSKHKSSPLAAQLPHIDSPLFPRSTDHIAPVQHYIELLQCCSVAVLLCKRRCPINKRSAAGGSRATGCWSAVHQERGPDCVSLASGYLGLQATDTGREGRNQGALLIAEQRQQPWLRRTPAPAQAVLDSESFLPGQSKHWSSCLLFPSR